jgi:DNA-directed RNA polymerase subunit RPC12/RpoP
MDEAALTARDPEWLRELLAEETRRREATLRKARPHRYLYVCPSCGKEYPRVKKYSRAVSCGHCDQRFNAAFLLQARPLTDASDSSMSDEAADKRA